MYQISRWAILNFWTKFTQQRYLCSKTEKVDIIIEFCIFKLVLVPNFSLNWQFWFFWPDLPKKVFSVENRKSQHGILHIWISLGTKFQLKLIVLSFWTKFTQKGYFQSKTEQAVQWLQAFTFYVINLNSTVVFKHFRFCK